MQSHDSDEFREDVNQVLRELEIGIGVFDIHAVSKYDVLKILNGELVAVEDDYDVERSEAHLRLLETGVGELVE